MGGCFERTGLKEERRKWVMSSQEPLPCTSFFISYVRLFFSCIFSSSCASRPCLVIFLYSTSSASSPWSPSISKAAYLLAELNFWKVKTKQTLDQYSSFGCYKNIAYTRQKMSTFSWSMKRKIRDNYSMTDVGLVLIGLMLVYFFIFF